MPQQADFAEKTQLAFRPSDALQHMPSGDRRDGPNGRSPGRQMAAVTKVPNVRKGTNLARDESISPVLGYCSSQARYGCVVTVG